MQAVFIAGGARRLKIATPQMRFTTVLTSAWIAGVSLWVPEEEVQAGWGAGNKWEGWTYLYSPCCCPVRGSQAGYPGIIYREQDLGEIEMLDCSYWKSKYRECGSVNHFGQSWHPQRIEIRGIELTMAV